MNYCCISFASYSYLNILCMRSVAIQQGLRAVYTKGEWYHDPQNKMSKPETKATATPRAPRPKRNSKGQRPYPPNAFIDENIMTWMCLVLQRCNLQFATPENASDPYYRGKLKSRHHWRNLHDIAAAAGLWLPVDTLRNNGVLPAFRCIAP